MWASFTDGRSWLTAHKAELKVFSDCARATLRWNDGHWAYVIEDDEAAARAALRRYGFDA